MESETNDWKTAIRERVRDVLATGAQEADVIEEITHDLEARHAALVQQGVEAPVARELVLAELDADRGLAHQLARIEREPLGGRHIHERGFWWEQPRQDTWFALKTFARRPLFTTVALAAIGLGVAGLTTVFSLVSTVLIGTLPLTHFERVVLVWQQDVTNGRDRMTLSPFEFQAYAAARSFDSVAAIRGVQMSVGNGTTPLAVSGLLVTPTAFDTLGVVPILGRRLSAESDEPFGNEAVITAELWRREFGADPGIVGKVLTLRGGASADPTLAAVDGPRVIVGVLPDGVSLPYRAADVWLPMPRPSAALSPGEPTGLVVFGRLAPDATVASGGAEVQTIARQLREQFPERSPNIEARLVTLREEIVGDVTPTLILLSAAVVLISLIVCANIGNMLLSRLAERQRELAIRRALGATRRRLLQQMLTESAVLGMAGGAVGVVLAYWMTRALAATGPATIPRVAAVGLDWSALIVATLASVLMSVAFGLLPALRIVRLQSNPLVRRAGNTAEGARLREYLTIAECALAFTVLVGAGLVLASARALEGAAVGYDPASALTFRVALPQQDYAQPEQRAAFFETLLDRLRALPGVTQAGAVSILPQMDTNRTVEFDLDGATGSAVRDRPSARFRVATPGYFESLSIPLISGRTFEQSDLAGGAVVISRSLAERFWPASDPLGHQLGVTVPGTSGSWLTIVGVVGDVRQWINTPPEPTIYWADAHQFELAVAVRTGGDAAPRSARRWPGRCGTSTTSSPSSTCRPWRSGSTARNS